MLSISVKRSVAAVSVLLLFPAAAGPQPLGRNLSGGANATVNLIEPGTLYGPVRNNFDARLSKVLKFGPTRRAIISLDVYNLTNSDTVLAFNNSFVPGGMADADEDCAGAVHEDRWASRLLGSRTS
jgi:hypothetical protein